MAADAPPPADDQPPTSGPFEDDDDIWTTDEPVAAGPAAAGEPASSSVPAAASDDPWAVPTRAERAQAKAAAKAARAAAPATPAGARRTSTASRTGRVVKPEPTGWRYEVRGFLELAALSGVAIVLPILGPFGESPETFVGAGAKSRDIVVFALLVALVPLLVLTVAATATRAFGIAVRRNVQVGLVGLLAGMSAVWISRHQSFGSGARVVAGLVVAIGVAYAYRRFELLRVFLRCAAATPAILVVAFLFGSQVTSLVQPKDVEVPKLTAVKGDHPDVVVLVLDELPTLSLVDGKGQIDASRFPNIAKFASTSTWYRNHSAVAPETLLALPALTTGKTPLSGNDEPYADYQSYPDNIFTLFGKTHEAHAVEWATDLCPPSVCPPVPDTLDQTAKGLLEADIKEPHPTKALLQQARSLWTDQVDPLQDTAETSFAFPGSEDSTQLALPGLQFLTALTKPQSSRPVFDWLDVGLPHQPWRLLPSGDQYNGPQSPAGSVFLGFDDTPEGTQAGLAARSNHLLQLQWTDRLLGKIFARLKSLDRFKDAVVVLTADHGVSFTPGQPIRDLTPANETQISFPPLFIKAPGQTAGKVDDGNVMSIDLLPTLADYAGVKIPWKVDGLSVAEGVKRTDPSKITVALDPERFPVRGYGDVVRIDASGLDAIKKSPFVTEASPAGQGADGLNVYRYGRQGYLVGQKVSDFTSCRGGPSIDYSPPKGWKAWVAGTFDRDRGKVPLFHSGKIDAPGSRDVVLAVDGVIAGWGVTRPDEPGNPFSILLAESLTKGAKGDPVPYEVQSINSCQLRRFSS